MDGVTLVAWAALTCLGLPYPEPVEWMVVWGLTPHTLQESSLLPTPTISYTIPLTPAPGEVLYARVRAVDAAGNRSGNECGG